MRYHNITKDDMLNGDGLRVVLWVAGCDHHCKECHNPITGDAEGGLAFVDAAKEEIFAELQKDYIHGITFSGGDPLHRANVAGITALAKEIREKFPNKTQWLYTGAMWEEINSLGVVKYLDVLCDGEFILAKKDGNAHWVGSTNQRVINVQESRKRGVVVFHEDGCDD